MAQLALANQAPIGIDTLEDVVGNEEIQAASPEQLMKLQQVINQDTNAAIVEGLVQSDPVAMMQKEKEENERAAAEAAKDLYDDFGEQPAGSGNNPSQ